MLLGKYTLYKGKQYKVFDYDRENKVVKIKVEDCEKNNINYKFIKREEVECIYYIQTNCVYKGYNFQIIAEKEDKILIYTSNCNVGNELNMDFIERSVFHKWIEKNKVDETIEEKTILNL